MAHIETRHIETIHDMIEDWIRGATDNGKFNLNRSYQPWLEFELFPSHYTLGNLLDELRTIVPESSLFPMQKMIFRAWDEIYSPIASARRPFAGSYFFFKVLTPDGNNWLLRPAPASTEESPFRFDALRRVLKITDSNQVTVITGYSHDEIQRFVAEPLNGFFDSERIPYSHVSFEKGNKTGNLIKSTIETDPEVILMDWTKNMENNGALIEALKGHLRFSKNKRLIILYGVASAILNYTKALGLLPFIEKISPQRSGRVPVVGLLPQFMNDWQVADELFSGTTSSKLGAARVITSTLPALPCVIEHLRPYLHGDFSPRQLEKAIATTEKNVMGDNKVFIYSGDRIKPQSEFPQNIYYAKDGFEVFYLNTGNGQASIPPAFNPNPAGEPGIASAGFSMAVSAARYLNNFGTLWAPPVPGVLLAHFLFH